MRKKYNQKGFTLLEVTLALVLFSILISTAFMLFQDSYKTYIDFQNKANLLEDSRMITEFIQEEIRTADYVKMNIVKKGVGVEGAPSTTPKYHYLTELKLEPEEVDGKLTGKNTLLLNVKQDLSPPSSYPAQGKINYQGVTIADTVQYILVEEKGDLLEIECTLKNKTGGSTEEKMTSKVLISIAYKK